MNTYQVKTDCAVITYSIDFGKRKNLYLTIKDGEVIIKAPLKTPIKYIEKVVLSKQKWILDKIALSSNQEALPPTYNEGETFHILGEAYQLKIIYYNQSKIRLEADKPLLTIFLPIDYKNQECQELIKKSLEKYYRQRAVEEVSLSLGKMVTLTGLKPTKVTVKKLTSSWGRCSSKGTISMNLNLAKYSRDAIDYVMLHELCHLKHMNHSKDFWSLVESYMPDYKEKIKMLKTKL